MDKSPVVLVVEDDVEMNELQCELLELNGLDSVSAYSGTEALDTYHRCKTDAVLLDIMLPEIDGYEICRRLREQNGKKIPIVMVTALDSDDCRKRGYEVGADAYFPKPFDPEEVISTLKMLISHSNGDNEVPN